MQFFKQLFSHGYQHRQLLVLVFLLTGLAALLRYCQSTETLDWLVYDSVQQLSRLEPVDDIVVIEIDEKSISALGRWPWTRDVHAKMLNRLSSADTAAVLFDVIFADRDETNPEADQLLAQAIAEHGRVVLPLFIKQVSLNGQVLEVPPSPLFYQAAKAVGHVHISHDRDGVVRSVYLKEGVGLPYWPHISVALWQLSTAAEKRLPGMQYDYDEVSLADNPYIIARDYHNYLAMPSPRQGLRHYSYIDVLNGQFDLRALRNKTIFIGSTAAGLGDTLTTSVGTLSGVELNAWIYHTLRNQRFIQQTADKPLIIINSLVTFIVLLILGRLSPRAFFATTSAVVLGLLVVSAILQLFFHQWLPVMPVVIAVTAFYPLWSWWRLEAALGFLRQELNDLTEANEHDHLLIQERDNETLIGGEGTELVTQTIKQLTVARHRAETTKRLIQYSLAELQDAVVICDLSGRIILSNKAFSDLITTHDSLAISTVLAPVVLAPIELNNHQRWQDVLAQANKTKIPFSIQGFHTVLNKDFFCQGRVVSIGGEVDDALILTLTDITQIKAAEKSRSEALSFLSHDLRSPMVSVLAIIERLHSSPVLEHASLESIEVLVKKNIDYADSFLQLSRAESLQVSQLQLCDLHSVLDSAQIQAMALTSSKNMQLVVHRIDQEAWVLGDHELLERALINLLSNAVKYSPEESCITLSLCAKENLYQLKVEDQGVGIAEQDLATLFDRYTRSSSQLKEIGVGLGLYFSATVARRHQGAIDVDSRAGQGSVFTFSLPSTTAMV